LIDSLGLPDDVAFHHAKILKDEWFLSGDGFSAQFLPY